MNYCQNLINNYFLKNPFQSHPDNIAFIACPKSTQADSSTVIPLRHNSYGIWFRPNRKCSEIRMKIGLLKKKQYAVVLNGKTIKNDDKFN